MPGTILVIDDSLTIRKLLEMSLSGAGHPVQLAGTGVEGIALAQRLHPSLILLDHVLPDRKGTDVCAALAVDPATAAIPIIVMSAKGDDIRAMYRGPMVAACIAKPFSPPAILHLVAEVLRRQEPAPTPAVAPTTSLIRNDPGTATFRPNDPATAAAAQAIFNVLRDRLAQVPSWLPELGGQPAAAFLARRLLTPEAVARLLDVVAPLVAAARPVEPAASAPALPSEAALLAGSTGLIDLPVLIRLLGSLGRTGTLLVGAGGRAVTLSCDRGDVVMALPADDEAAIAAAIASGWRVGAGDRERALAAGPGPLLAALAATQAGNQAAAELYRIGIQALTALGAAGPQPFQWSDATTLPALVRAHGRPITGEQLTLERLRLVDDWTQVEQEVSSLDQVFERSGDLRARLPRLVLAAPEQGVLNRIDGRRSVRAVVDGCELSTFEVFHIMFRLIRCGLVRPRDAAGGSPASLAPVLCAHPDSVLRDPIVRLFNGLGLPRPTLAGDPAMAADALAATARRLALVDVAGVDAAAVAGLVRGRLDTSDATLVALTDRPEDEAALTAAGYDLVLSTPVHADEIHHLLGI